MNRRPDPRPRALLLDFYGTLAHSPGLRFSYTAGLVAEGLRREGIDVSDEAFAAAYRAAVVPYLELMRQGTETHNTAWASDALATLGVAAAPDDGRVVRAVRYFFETYAETIEPLAGVPETLMRLGARYPLVLVSNFTDALPVRRAISRLGWADHFRAIYVSADLGVRKPHPEIFRRALAAADCSPADALFVGDDPEEDIAGAAAAGIPTVHVDRPMLSPLRSLVPATAERIPPDWTIGALPELLPLLGCD